MTRRRSVVPRRKYKNKDKGWVYYDKYIEPYIVSPIKRFGNKAGKSIRNFGRSIDKFINPKKYKIKELKKQIEIDEKKQIENDEKKQIEIDKKQIEIDKNRKELVVELKKQIKKNNRKKYIKELKKRVDWLDYESKKNKDDKSRFEKIKSLKQSDISVNLNTKLPEINKIKEQVKELINNENTKIREIIPRAITDKKDYDFIKNLFKKSPSAKIEVRNRSGSVEYGDGPLVYDSDGNEFYKM
jgi:hypothetical protein